MEADFFSKAESGVVVVMAMQEQYHTAKQLKVEKQQGTIDKRPTHLLHRPLH